MNANPQLFALPPAPYQPSGARELPRGTLIIHYGAVLRVQKAVGYVAEDGAWRFAIRAREKGGRRRVRKLLLREARHVPQGFENGDCVVYQPQGPEAAHWRHGTVLAVRPREGKPVMLRVRHETKQYRRSAASYCPLQVYLQSVQEPDA